jgi:hypothetical protein
MDKTPEAAAGFDRNRVRAIAYWTVTLPVAFENAAGSVWVMMRIEYLHAMLTHLGYPQYFQYILGPWQFACAATLLAPGLRRAKEWAYAGAFINYSSAFLSHMFVGDSPDVGAAVFAALTVASAALRPPDRRLAGSMPAGRITARSWAVPAIVLGLMLVLSLFSLPQATRR